MTYQELARFGVDRRGEFIAGMGCQRLARLITYGKEGAAKETGL
jgi:hypothetical protein